MAWGAVDDSPQALGTITTCTLDTVAKVPFFRDSLTRMECQIFRSDPNSSIIRRPAIKNGSSAILWKRGRGILGSTYAREFGKHGPR